MSFFEGLGEILLEICGDFLIDTCGKPVCKTIGAKARWLILFKRKPYTEIYAKRGNTLIGFLILLVLAVSCLYILYLWFKH